MADFSGRIVSAQYANTERTIIKVLYEEDGKLFPYSFPNDENNPDYQDLMKEDWDHEKIADATADRLRGEKRAYDEQINAVARELAKEMLGMKVLEEEKQRLEEEKEKLNSTVNEKEQILIGLDKEVKVKTNAVDTAFFQSFWDVNENKEELFKFKLWALELDAVKNADKSIKSSIRKVNRISQGMAILDDLM